MNKHKAFATLLVLLASNASADQLKGRSVYDLTLKELLETRIISLATGSEIPLAKAPSVASVITADDINKMGATTLSELLSSVPGMYVSRSSQLYAPKFVIRGMSTFFNPQTLMLINGTPISSVVRGDRQAVWGMFPVNAIERVEVIRGPGSALYGADAFAGVINIITKKFNNQEKSQMGIRLGAFNTHDLWAQSSYQQGDLKLFLSGQYNTTDGHKEVIEHDAQTNFDNAQLSEPVSLAPGSVNVGSRGFDVNLDINYHNFNFQGLFQDRDNIGTAHGVGNALDPNGKAGGERLLLSMDYQRTFNPQWFADVKLSHHRSSQWVEESLILFPKGAFFGAFKDGLSGNPGWGETNQIIQTRLIYFGNEIQKITFGGGYRKEDLYRVTETKNFDANFAPLNALTDVTDTPDIFLPETKRDNYFAYVQNEYKLAANWELTLGIRYDDYSDFGATTNPRAALVWSTDENLTTKFLYGRAFRRPTVLETHAINNPVALGNPNIEPETIDTFEVAFSYQANPQLQMDINLYRFSVKDLIDFVPDDGGPTNTAQNIGKVQGFGIEMEVSYQASEAINLLVNYAYQATTDKTTDDDLGGAPTRQLYAKLNWQLSESIHFNSQIKYVGKTPRNTFDPRGPTGAYTNVAVALRFNALFSEFDLHIKAENLFDEDIRHPSDSPSNGQLVAIPNDLPQAGRALYFGLSRLF